MKKLLLFAFCSIVGGYSALYAQQDPMFTKYMFNPLSYNPAYAGSADALDLVLLHRHQWVGFGNGAPMTQNLTLHSPIKAKNISLGVNTTLDRIGVSRSFSLYTSFAYRVRFGDPEKKGGYISMGLQGGFANWTADWSQLNLDDPNDPSFQNAQPNVWLPNFGTGIYVHTKTWFVGLSSPLLITNALRKRTANEPANLPIAQQYRHYYLTGGAAFKIGTGIVFRPTMLIKSAGFNRNELNKVSAPTEFDIDAAFLFNNTFWVGTAFRSAFGVFNGNSSYDSVDFWASVRLKNGLRIGAAFDYTLTKLRSPAQASYELMIGYDLLRLNTDKIEHIRYF